MSRPFFLYLRPFEMKGSFFWTNYSRGIINQYVEPTHIEFEQQLANSLGPIAPPIGVGDHRTENYVGIGRAVIPPGSDWKEFVAKLAISSLMNFIVPSHHNGTKWEIEFIIRNNLTHKSLFLIPDQYASSLGKHSYDSWMTATKAVMRDTFNIDMDDARGSQYFELMDKTSLVTPNDLKNLDTRSIEKFLSKRGIMRTI